MLPSMEAELEKLIYQHVRQHGRWIWIAILDNIATNCTMFDNCMFQTHWCCSNHKGGNHACISNAETMLPSDTKIRCTVTRILEFKNKDCSDDNSTSWKVIDIVASWHVWDDCLFLLTDVPTTSSDCAFEFLLNIPLPFGSNKQGLKEWQELLWRKANVPNEILFLPSSDKEKHFFDKKRHLTIQWCTRHDNLLNH